MDELTFVKEMRGHRPAMPDEVERSVRDKLSALAAAEGRRRGRRRSAVRSRGALAVALAVVATMAVGVAEVVRHEDDKMAGPGLPGKLIPWPPGSGPMPKDVPSAGSLRGVQLVSAVQLGDRAAKAAERMPYTAPKPTQWIYTRTMSAPGFNMSTWWKGVDVGSRHTTEEWTRVDGRATAFPSSFAPKLKLFESPGRPFGGKLFHLGNYQRLPTRPDALLRYLYAARYPDQVGATSPHSVFETMAQILRDPCPPKLRAAVFRALPKIKGVTVQRGVPDVAGRLGLAFAHVNDYGERLSIILDPASYALLGEQETVARPRRIRLDNGSSVTTKPGTVLSWSATLAIKVVDQPGLR